MTDPQTGSKGKGARLIGCAGWTIPKDAAAAFPEVGSHLERYAAVFPVVEINSSFYRPHRPQTYARWAASVPEHFRFSVKLPKAISHDACLRDAEALLEQFAQEAGNLGDKLGCVLVQLPPKQEFNAAVAAAFFEQLQGVLPCMVACEGRHSSWFGDEATALLRERGITRVMADPPAGQPGPHVPTSEVAYIRLHGAPRVYYSSYPADLLERLAAWVAVETSVAKDVWCIFDNTAAGAAVPNALDVLRADPGHRHGNGELLPLWCALGPTVS
jgi:uncharacterized protein YecE (DUF72 family)